MKKQIISSLLFILLIFQFFSCTKKDNSTFISEEYIADSYIQETLVQEEMITEETIQEEIIAEEYFKEEVIQEFLLNELLLVEDNIPDDVQLKQLSISVIDGNKYQQIAKEYDVNWTQVITKFSIGTSVIVFTGVAIGISAATGNEAVAFVFAHSFKGAIKEASIGACVGAAIGALVGAAQSGGDISAIKKYAIEGAADGFMWGAITGAISGGIEGYKNRPISEFADDIAANATETTAVSALPGEAEVVNKYGKIAADMIKKFGQKAITLLERYGDLLVECYTKWGDDVIKVLTKVDESLQNGRRLLLVLKNNSNQVGETILKIANSTDDVRQINRVVRYLEAWGDKGLRNINRWKGVVPENITYDQLRLWKQINNSGTRKLADEVLKNSKKYSGIKLTKEELAKCLSDKNYFAELVRHKTGKAFCGKADELKGYQEFFIRMKKSGNEKQIEALWSNPEIMEYIKNSGIRAGGVHEWLMAKNFEDFLVNPKWGDDGSYLVLVLDKLVQKTGNVTFKNGGAHGATGSGAFHNRLSDIIENCNDAAEILDKTKAYAKEVLTMDSYIEFCDLLYRIF